jgi:transposase
VPSKRWIAWTRFRRFSPNRAERHCLGYYRHGTLSLFAALNAKSGEIIGQTSDRHTSAKFVAFLEDLVARQAPKQAVHIICDNLSAHKTKAVCNFLARHPEVRIHYTPTYSSWLNQVEIWFSKIQRDLIGSCDISEQHRTSNLTSFSLPATGLRFT